VDLWDFLFLIFMTNVTIYKKATDVSNGFTKDVMFCLERIKQGKSKDLVEWLRTLSKKEYDENKTKLPGVCFNGVFEYRSLAGIKEHSGLIILDFDKFETSKYAIDFKNSISDDDYIFSCWISPSGKGVKALVKIPKDIQNHREYFKALKNYYNHPNWDDSGSDVSRFCFESYDPDLFINENSKVWDKIDMPEVEEIGQSDVTIPIKSDNLIINNLLKWFKDKYNSNERNKSLFKLASAFNDFGINKIVAEQTLYQFEQSDFDRKEINKILNSAYKKTSNFGTKFFEDKTIKQKIEKQIRTGKSKKEVIDTYKDFDKKEIEKCIDDIKEDISVSDFWYYNDKGKINLSPHKYKFWLQQNNFFKYFPTDSNTFTFIKIEQNLVEETSEKRIKDFVLDHLLSRSDIGFSPYDFMASSPKYFQNDFLSFLESSEIKIKDDTQNECFLYFENCVVKVTDESIETIDYLDLDGFVWKRQIINRVYESADHHDSVFRKFLWLISGQDAEKYNSFKSVIGYLLHSFKTSANNKAIIFNDETISENPNGGSGKGLFWNALSQMKKVSSIDGKTFEFTKSFPYQTVSTDTQILVFDDVKKNFNFESLFSLITEGITLEYKGQDAIKLPVQKSPKILITTNYTVGGVGGSFERRKFEVEMSDYFSYKHTPLDEFGHLLFDEWDEKEWSRFDNFMIQCVQYYLLNGLTKHDFKNLEVRKFIKNTSFEFFEWTKPDAFGKNDNIEFNTRCQKQTYYDAFVNEYPDFRTYKLSQKRFTQWIEHYCKFYNYVYLTGNSNGQRWFEIVNKNVETEENNDIAF
jgi:hypothetical protein